MKMGDRPELKIDVVSTGILSLDLALGVGGLPRGRIVEIYGPESSGKTTIALQTIAELQKPVARQLILTRKMRWIQSTLLS